MKKTVLLATIACLLTAASVPVHAEEVFFFEAESSGNVYVFDFGAIDNPRSAVPNLPPYIPEDEQATVQAPTYTPPQTQRPALPTYSPPKPAQVDVAAYAEEVFRLANAEREAAGLPLLTADSTLSEMANVRAKELESLFSHTRPDGRKCSSIFTDFEYANPYGGENIAARFKTPSAVVAGWMNSDGHRRNILRSTATRLGVGVWQDSKGILHWEMLFAK